MSSTPEIVFAGTNGGALTEIADYEAVGGFQALAKSRALAPDDVIAELNSSNLRGRGGAGFPAGLKWTFLPKDHPGPNRATMRRGRRPGPLLVRRRQRTCRPGPTR